MVTQSIAEKYRAACMAELSALKPGNVHIFSDGHGMVVQDFIKSADASMLAIAKPGISVGVRILEAVKATWGAVACNTNLGIILLAAPMIQAALQSKTFGQNAVQQVLATLSVADAENAYQAIQIAKPAGLGEAEEHDVSASPQVSLLAAMQAAANRDLIAQQYANGFAEVFGLGCQTYQTYLKKWERPAWATTAVYLAFLATFEDSHITRKYGSATAQTVQKQAQSHWLAFAAQDNPKLYQATLLEWDQSLKNQGLNPGTSADLTVATMLAVALLHS